MEYKTFEEKELEIEKKKNEVALKLFRDSIIRTNIICMVKSMELSSYNPEFVSLFEACTPKEDELSNEAKALFNELLDKLKKNEVNNCALSWKVYEEINQTFPRLIKIQ